MKSPTQEAAERDARRAQIKQRGERRDELRNHIAVLEGEEKRLLATQNNGGEVLARLSASIDMSAKKYGYQITAEATHGRSLSLPFSMEALCFFMGDEMKRKLESLIAPGGMPEEERIAELGRVRNKLITLHTELAALGG